ncbi:alkaline phosphatase [Jeotgalibacillus soli]|uniref:Alkaline phosphatase n=1 Tax=Jeotgalibacillus soli TaxID=889306 RepID=A0A0C2QX67_9BACL|nr:alkaline phosphatase [Jeotgalibacillus soli]KIL42680.1 alkaline phosphatase [Jeotgalibacillus soli]
MRKLFVFMIAAGLVVGGSIGATQLETKKETEDAAVKNVILMIPDGFSSSQAAAYRWFKGENSIMDMHLVGMMKTYSANTAVTDSAAAGTAMATGEKTNNGMISMSPNGKEFKTILEESKENGKAAGLVVTSAITHATPAAFGSHVASRSDQEKIAPQLIEQDIDVLFGGGARYFSESMMKGAAGKGYTIIKSRDALKKSGEMDKVIGLFTEEALATALERSRKNQPSLAEMTSSAIEILTQNKDGFFLMVEGSQIDWAGHANDAAWSMHEIKDFEGAVKAALNFAEQDKQTLVVIAGDHETGGMTVGSNDQYDVNMDVIRNVIATGDKMAEELSNDRSNAREVVEKNTTLKITDKQEQLIKEATEENLPMTINRIISDKALIGWTTSVHTGVDVPVYAYGPKYEKFAGLINNTDIAHKLAEAMDFNL